MPAVGDKVRMGNLELTVESMRGRRIDRVLLELAEDQSAAGRSVSTGRGGGSAMTTLALGLAAVAFLLVAGFFSGCEMGLYCVNRIRLRLRAENAPQARLLLRLTEQQEQSVLSILLWQSVAGYLLTLVATAWLTRVEAVGPAHIEFYAAAMLSPLAFAFDVVPKNWFRIEADRLMYRAARGLYAGVAVMRVTGVIWLLEQALRLIVRLIAPGNREQWKGPRGEVIGLLREGAARARSPRSRPRSSSACWDCRACGWVRS